jgi:hypothetical protein
MLYHGLGTIVGIVAFVCAVIIWIHAFKSSILWGLLCLCLPCPFGLYYAIFKFEHENKGLITLGYLFGGSLAAALHGYGSHELWGPLIGIGHNPHHR